MLIKTSLNSDILCSHQILRRRLSYRVHAGCIHKRRLRNDTSERSSVAKGVKSKERKITNNTNYYGKSNTVEDNVAPILKKLIEFRGSIKVKSYFICVICHISLYKGSARNCSMNNTSLLVNKLLHLQKSHVMNFFRFVGLTTVK